MNVFFIAFTFSKTDNFSDLISVSVKTLFFYDCTFTSFQMKNRKFLSRIHRNHLSLKRQSSILSARKNVHIDPEQRRTLSEPI